MVTYFIAVNPDLTLKWSSSMQQRLTDGCGVLLPIAANGVTTMANSCRYGTTVGVDPSTNAKGSSYLSDQASSTPTVLPDDSVVLGTLDDFNYSRGHLMHFDAQGNFINAYTFGWDNTPAVYEHDNTYSLVVKDNHYPEPAYCYFTNPVCTPVPAVYYVSQIDPQMNVEWSFQNTEFNSTNPNGYEWCVNAPLIDRQGIVYATSEDGHVYSIPQGNTGVFTTPLQKIFLLEALGAAYTPMAIGEDGKEYSQNNGHLFVIGK
jgi:outer membrane protein assembly factor BamB